MAKEMFDNLVRKCIRRAKICNREISGTVGHNLGVSDTTVHVYYNLQAADLPCNLVIRQATLHKLVIERGALCIIWGEVSISRHRTFELANYIHHAFANEE